jgi:pimeloyl-ACP methyl ester carboxylesterase
MGSSNRTPGDRNAGDPEKASFLVIRAYRCDVGNNLAPFLSPVGYRPPRYWALARELAVAPEIGHAAARVACSRAGRLRTPYAGTPRPGGGEPVLLLPGFLAGDYSLRVLAAALRAEGYRTYRSEIRSNVACLDGAALLLERRLEAIVARRERRVRLVGHSLGGMLATGLAVRRPDLVAGVVAMGSPMMAPGTAHPLLTSTAGLLVRLSRAGLPGLMSDDCVAGECARRMWAELHGEFPAGVALGCLYSRRDGFVDWRSCIHPAAVSTEVRATHIGMAIAPAVHDQVLAELARQRQLDDVPSLRERRTAG